MDAIGYSGPKIIAGKSSHSLGVSSTDTGGPNSRGLHNLLHVSVKWPPEGMGLGNGKPVAAVHAAPRGVMNSDTCWKLPLGAFKSMSSRINSVARKREDAYCMTTSICFL